MNDLISKSELRKELAKLSSEMGFVRKSDVMRILGSMPCKDNVVVLPCGPNTTVYEVYNNADACLTCGYLSRGYNCEDQCMNESVKGMDGEIYVPNPQYSDTPLCEKHFYKVRPLTLYTLGEALSVLPRFGKTVFLTQAEAYAKLEELNKEMEHD